MEPKDYSTELFSLNGNEPSFLPLRLRLANGDTRYSYSISLEELNELGYQGPINKPSCTNQETIYWCCDSLCYIKRLKNEDEKLADEYFFAKQTVKEILTTEENILKDVNLTAVGRSAYLDYFGRLKNIYYSEIPFGYKDIPQLNLPWNYSYATEKYVYDKTVQENYDYWKYCFENLGVNIPSLDPVGTETFVIPSGWVAAPNKPLG